MYCTADGSPPARVRDGENVPHPSGRLKRVSLVDPKLVETLATDLLDVHKLTVQNAAAFIATPHGVVRVGRSGARTLDPSRATVRLAAIDDVLIGAFRSSMGEQQITSFKSLTPFAGSTPAGED
jgi:hypothetical protein